MFARLKQMFASKPPTEFHDPALGRFEGTNGIWTTTIQRESDSFLLSLGGSETAPDERLVSAALALLPRFIDLRQTAISFITPQESGAHSAEFCIYGVEWLWEDRPEDFTFEFTRTNDLDGIWRVEFESGTPKFLGRDD